MLPYVLYELLPYLYLVIGTLGCVWFESKVVLIASVLMILAGFIILWMRIDYRRNSLDLSSGDVNYAKRSNVERRQNTSVSFPLVDSAGILVKVDRRMGERRVLQS